MVAAPPATSPLARHLIAALDRLSRVRRRHAFLVPLLGLPATLAIDLATGREFAMILIYGLLTCFTAWTLGERAGLKVVAAIFTGMVAQPYVRTLWGQEGPDDLGRLFWNAGNRSVVLALLGLTVSTLRSLLALERWRADTDALTGALNKGAFNRRMADAVRRAQRGGRSLMLAYMDLDGFKGVNDAFGHAAGDRVLQAFARGTAGAIRHTDLFARVGGDEFVVLMTVPDCNGGDAAAATLHNRLRRVLADTGFAVGCSMGALVAEAGQLEPGDDMIGMADGLMYEVKRSGKNALRLARATPGIDPLAAAFPRHDPDGAFGALLRRLDGVDGRRAA